MRNKYYLKNRMFLIVMFITCAGYSQSKNIGKQIQNSKTANNNTLHPNGIFFTQNNGQIIDVQKRLHPEILFKGDGGGANIYLRKNGVSFVLNNLGQIFSEANENEEDSENEHSLDPALEQKMQQEFLSKQILKTHRIDVDFDGSNLNPSIISSEQITGYSNYYFAHCPDGILNVPSYNQITVKNIYDN
ncbi:MAG: hypothetical protein JNL63_07680, partial [Bacteroidia bacterium]|nr:hypothetical protein [Bacteroidia bacterium]